MWRHYFVHGSYIWNIFFTEEKFLSKILKYLWPGPSHYPQVIVKCHWEIQKPLGDAFWNIKWEIYNEINWFTHYGWFTKKKMWLVNLKKKVLVNYPCFIGNLYFLFYLITKLFLKICHSFHKHLVLVYQGSHHTF